MYARVLGLQYLRPSNLLCFAFFEGAIALAALLALAELAQWWVVLVLPASIAAMVKLNDVIAGAVQAVQRAGGSGHAPKALGRAKVPVATAAFEHDAGADESIHSPQQRARQSGARRYD